MDYSGVVEILDEEALDEEQFVKRQFEQWKDKYGEVYVTDIEGMAFVWRTLTRNEFKKAQTYFDDDFDRTEFVCRMCVLDPIVDDYANQIYAGIPEVIAQNILDKSGFSSDSRMFDELMHKYDSEMQSMENQLSCVIKEVFQDISIEEIEDWTLDKTMWHFSRAKWILSTLRGVTLQKEDKE